MKTPLDMLKTGVSAETLPDFVQAAIAYDWSAAYDAAEESSDEVCEIGDACEAIYWFGADCHGGQWSDEYRLLSVIGEIFRPGPISRGPEADSTAADWYAELCAAAGCSDE